MKKYTKFNLIPLDYKDPNKMTFQCEPLETGMGTTLGNALRRICVANIPGAAMFAVKIPGYNHEFQAIEGVSDDITQILLNLKKLALKVDEKYFTSDEFANYKIEQWPTLKIKAMGPEVVKAGDIECPPGFEIINKDLRICQITDSKPFEMEIYATTGRGFRSTAENKDLVSHLTIIPTDSKFNPVLHFNYKVEEFKTSKSTTSERLIIDIATNGVISAEEAIAIASKILIAHFEPFAELSDVVKELTVMNVKDEDTKKANLFIPIEELDFTVRAYNALKTQGIHMTQQLLELSKHDIEKIKNLGRKSVNEIISKVHERGLKLKDE